MSAVLIRLRRFYGAHPLHLLALLGCFALAGYAALRTVEIAPAWPTMLIWFAAAVVGHDLVLFPLYALADLSLASVLHVLRPRHRPTVRPRVPAVNYLRTPVLGALLTFVLFLPGIIEQGAGTYRAATGLTQAPFLARWLLLCAAMFGVSAVAYAVRLGRATAKVRSALRPVRVLVEPGERLVTMAFETGGAIGAVASTRALYHRGAEPDWHAVVWADLADVSWEPAAQTLVGTPSAEGERLRLPLADPGDLVGVARGLIAAAPAGDRPAEV